MKRTLLALVVGAVLLMTTAVPAAAERSWRWDECRFRNYLGSSEFNRTEIEMTIRCGVRHFGGDVARTIAIMDCESGGGEYAYNPNGGYSGLFQFAPSTFAGTYERWEGLWQRWGVKRDVFNARSNALLAVKKMSADGYSAWSCA